MKTLSLLSCVGLVISSQAATWYFDSGVLNGGDGSIGAPFNSLDEVELSGGDSWLLKCGSQFDGEISVSVPDVTIESYGTGDRPVIFGKIAFSDNNGVLRNLVIDGKGTETTVGFKTCTNGVIDSCVLMNGHNALSAYYARGLFVITNTVAHNMLQEGFYGDGLETVQIDDCHVYDVNQYWVKGYYNLATGDGIQIGGSDHVTINNTLVDRRGTSAKFGIIIQGVDYFEMNNSQVIGSLQDELARTLNSEMYCAYMSGVTEVHINDCWFYGGRAGVWNQYSGTMDIRNCQFILNETFGIRGMSDGYLEGNLFYNAGYIGLGSGWSDSFELDGTLNVFYDNVCNGTGYSNFDTNYWCPYWVKAPLYDDASIGCEKLPFEPSVTEDVAWEDIPLFNGNEEMELHLYRSGTNFVEGYFLTDNGHGARLFFDMPFESFHVLDDAGVTIEIKRYQEGVASNNFYFVQDTSGATNFSFSGWEDSIYHFRIKDDLNELLFEKFVFKDGNQFDPLDFYGDDLGTDPLDAFRSDASIFSADTVEAGQPKNLVKTPFGFYLGYFMEFHSSLPSFYDQSGDVLIFNPVDSTMHYAISILTPSGQVIHRELNTRGLCEVFTSEWDDGFYHLSVISEGGAIWADVVLHRSAGSVDPFTYFPITTDSDTDGQTDWEERVAQTDPSDPSSLFRILQCRQTAEGFRVMAPTSDGVNYQTEWSTDLINWQSYGNPFSGSGDPSEILIDPATVGDALSVFIRLVVM